MLGHKFTDAFKKPPLDQDKIAFLSLLVSEVSQQKTRFL